MTYETTPDPNVFKEITTKEGFIYVDKLEAEITELNQQLKDVPQPKERPDDETLQQWNDSLPWVDVDALKKRIGEKEALLKELSELK